MSIHARLALLLGLALGVGLGLYYTWVVSPVQYVDTAPASLSADYKAEVALMAAEAYARERDLGRARTRLDELGLPDPAAYLAGLVQAPQAAGASQTERKYLARLAHDLGGTSPALEPYLP